MLAISSITAQENKIRFGVKAGLNISNQNIDNPIFSGTLDNKLRFHAGGLVEIPFSKSFSLQLELLYSHQGYRDDNGIAKQTTFLHYINIPVLVNYSIIDNLKIQAGPQIGFLLSGKTKTEIDPKIKNLVVSDELMLNQIFLNLVSNAVKFTEEGFITIRANCISETSESLCIKFSVRFLIATASANAIPRIMFV